MEPVESRENEFSIDMPLHYVMKTSRTVSMMTFDVDLANFLPSYFKRFSINFDVLIRIDPVNDAEYNPALFMWPSTRIFPSAEWPVLNNNGDCLQYGARYNIKGSAPHSFKIQVCPDS